MKMSRTRDQIEEKDKWRLEDIFETDDAWEKAYVRAEKDAGLLKDSKGRLAASADDLHACLSFLSTVSLEVERLYVYAHMRKDQDNGNALYQGMTDRAMQLSVALETESAFIEPEIISVPKETLRKWMEEDRFAAFRFYLEKIDRKREHILSEKEERILAMAEDPLGGPDNIFTMLSDVDLQFGTILDENGKEAALTNGTYGVFLKSKDRRVRKDAYEKFYSVFGSVKNTIAATYAASVKADVFRARARGFESSLEAALYGNGIPVSVYEQLIEAVHEKLPALRKYLDIRREKLGLETLEMYDLYVPLIPDCDVPLDFEQAKKLVKEALKPLGERYGELLDEAFANRWIDVYETPGKTSGAYSWGTYGVHPYVLLNHQNDLSHASTLAHELGHAMHSYHSNSAQPYETADYAIMVAEVASTVNEVLLSEHLLKEETDPKKRASIINEFLEHVRTTCFRQTMFAEFEWKAHQMAEAGEPLTVESLSKMYRELNELYYPGVNADDNIAMEWMRIPHFYNAFYVFQYATGICTAIALADSILRHDGRESYIRFLSSGGSDYPVKLLQNAGVDLTKKDSILSALDVFEDKVSELQKIVEEDEGNMKDKLEEEKAFDYILEAYKKQNDFSFIDDGTFSNMVRKLIALDEEYINQSGAEEDGVYDDDEAYEYLFNEMKAAYPQYKEYMMRLVDDYLDYNEAYLESIGAIEWD